MPRKLTIAIGGDTVPTTGNESFLINGQGGAVFHRVKDVFSSSDFAVANLECPLTSARWPISKAGPCLKAKPQTLDGLLDAGIGIFSLANNHIMDFGAEGLEETLTAIARKGALFTGAGPDLVAARRPLTIEKGGYRVTIISVAEHEFSIAEEDSQGANPFDPFDTIEDIREAGAAADSVIVLYHGGIEQYQLPSPNLQRRCRKMVDNGAAYVICQHSHCIGSYENYHDGHIVYGQGNLLFDYSDHEMWQTSLILKITIENSGEKIEFLPVVKKGSMIDLADGVEKERILRSFDERNTCVADKQYIEQEWSKFCDKRKYYYLQTLLGFGGLARRLDNRLGNFLTGSLYDRNSRILLYNFLYCESHLEIARSILRDNYLTGKE